MNLYYLPRAKRTITLHGAKVEIDCALVINIPESTKLDALRVANMLAHEDEAISLPPRKTHDPN